MSSGMFVYSNNLCEIQVFNAATEQVTELVSQKFKFLA